MSTKTIPAVAATTEYTCDGCARVCRQQTLPEWWNVVNVPFRDYTGLASANTEIHICDKCSLSVAAYINDGRAAKR